MTALTGTGTLIRSALRRDRVRLTVWISSIALSLVGSVASFASTYPTAADRQARATVLDTPVASLFVGPNYGKADYTYGAMTAHELLVMGGVAVALMSIFLVVRLSRAEEETGRTDLLRSAAVGRQAPIASALAVVGGAQLSLGVLLALGLPASAGGISVRGSIAFAAALTGIGLVFAAVAAVAAQLTVTARAATAAAALVMGATYLVRAIGDMSGSAFSQLSPFGWANAVEAYVDERWWVLGAPVAAACGFTAIAVALGRRRDVGAGILAERRGPAQAAPSLRTPLALAFRLQRNALLAWTVAMLALGVVYGAVASQAATLYENVDAIDEYLARIGAASATDQYLALTLFISALVACGWSIQSTLRLRSEEVAGRGEGLLTASVSRTQFAASHLIVSLSGSALVLAAYGVGEGISRSIDARDASELPRLVGAAVAYVPALWLFAAVALVLFGVVPRAANAVWGLFAVFAFVGFLGPLLRLPDWAYNLSPLEHVPRQPVASFTVVPLVALGALAVATIGLGMRGFDRREVLAG